MGNFRFIYECPPGFLECKNYRNNGQWTMLHSYRPLGATISLVLGAYLGWGGEIVSEKRTCLIFQSSVLGTQDVLEVRGTEEQIAAILKLCQKFQQHMAPGGGMWRALFQREMGIPCPVNMDIYWAMEAVGDRIECPGLEPMDYVQAVPSPDEQQVAYVGTDADNECPLNWGEQ